MSKLNCCLLFFQYSIKLKQLHDWTKSWSIVLFQKLLWDHAKNQPQWYSGTSEVSPSKIQTKRISSWQRSMPTTVRMTNSTNNAIIITPTVRWWTWSKRFRRESNERWPNPVNVTRTWCNIRRSIGNGSHTLDRMYAMYTYLSYNWLLSTIGLSLDRCAWGACEWVWPTLRPERTLQTSLEELMTRGNNITIIWECILSDLRTRTTLIF